MFFFFFFFNDTATTEIYTLSLHDALPICWVLLIALNRSRALACAPRWRACAWRSVPTASCANWACRWTRSEEHTSELQSRPHLVCRLLLEKKKKKVKDKLVLQ